MIEALDPRRPENHTPFHIVREKAHFLARDKQFSEALNSREIAAQGAEIVRTVNPHLPERDITALLTCIVASKLLLPHVLEDGRARNEIHILGEICRLMREVRIQEAHFHFKGLSAFKHLASTAINPVWTSPDYRPGYPTIDGNPAGQRCIASRFGTVMHASSVHDMWQIYFRTRILNVATNPVLDEVAQPLLLSVIGEEMPTDIAANPEYRYFHNGSPRPATLPEHLHFQ